VSEYLVGSPAFKAGGTGDPRPAGSIPVHLRQSIHRNGPACGGAAGPDTNHSWEGRAVAAQNRTNAL